MRANIAETSVHIFMYVCVCVCCTERCFYNELTQLVSELSINNRLIGVILLLLDRCDAVCNKYLRLAKQLFSRQISIAAIKSLYNFTESSFLQEVRS